MESHRLLLGIVVVSILVLALALGKPSITGFVPTEIVSQQLDIDVFESQRFVLSSDSVLSLSTFAISGSSSGGLVNVYLTDGISRWLVFSNRQKESSSMTQITGMVTGEFDIEPGEMLNSIESLPDGYTVRSGVFSSECVETCIMSFSANPAYLDVVMEPGASLHISEIRFASSK